MTMIQNKTPNQNKGRIKSEEKRQQILVAASDLFLHLGFENTSMDQVAINAQVSKQTVYSHFGNKEDLFSATIEIKCISNDLTEQLFQSNAPLSKVLYELAMFYTELILSDEAICLIRACVAETPQRDKVAKLFWEAGPQKLTKQFSKYLEQQNKLGTISVESPSFAAQQFLYMLRGEVHLLKFLGQPHVKSAKELPAYIKSCISMFIKTYAN